MLHEFGHVLGKDQIEAQVFAINLFGKAYSKALARLVIRDGLAIKQAEIDV